MVVAAGGGELTSSNDLESSLELLLLLLPLSVLEEEDWLAEEEAVVKALAAAAAAAPLLEVIPWTGVILIAERKGNSSCCLLENLRMGLPASRSTLLGESPPLTMVVVVVINSFLGECSPALELLLLPEEVLLGTGELARRNVAVVVAVAPEEMVGLHISTSFP